MENADLISGARAIASRLGLTERQVRHHHELGRIPTFKIGTTIVARRSTLNAWLAECAAKAAAERAEGGR